MSRLARGIAHDFNNLLTIIQGNTMPIDVVDLGALLSGVHASMMPMLSDRVAIRVITTEAALPVRVTHAAVEETLTSMWLSARDAMPDGGLPKIRLEALTVDGEAAARLYVAPGPYAQLQIRDSGPPMDEDARARAFEPFGVPPAHGRRGGMGLATLYPLATRLRGTLLLESTTEHGTLVTLLLPLVIVIKPAGGHATEFASPIAGLTVLVVEDEDAVRHLMRRVLVSSGYRVITANHGEDAMAVWHRHGDEIDLVVTDVVMPRMTGSQLVARQRSERPDVPAVCSGYSDALSSDVPAGDPCATYLRKPLTLQALADAVVRVDSAARRSASVLS